MVLAENTGEHRKKDSWRWVGDSDLCTDHCNDADLHQIVLGNKYESRSRDGLGTGLKVEEFGQDIDDAEHNFQSGLDVFSRIR